MRFTANKFANQAFKSGRQSITDLVFVTHSLTNNNWPAKLSYCLRKLGTSKYILPSVLSLCATLFLSPSFLIVFVIVLVLPIQVPRSHLAPAPLSRNPSILWTRWTM